MTPVSRWLRPQQECTLQLYHRRNPVDQPSKAGLNKKFETISPPQPSETDKKRVESGQKRLYPIFSTFREKSALNSRNAVPHCDAVDCGGGSLDRPSLDDRQPSGETEKFQLFHPFLPLFCEFEVSIKPNQS